MKSIKTVDTDGVIRYKNEKGQFYRINGPAIEKPSGYKAWIVNDMYHREDGPARILSNGDKYYYLKGKRYSKEEWEREVLKLKLKRIKDL